jgi:alcohol dehydrogenase YqhD (iron-dependent ADH family)
MQNFVFDNPTRIIFGQGMIARTGSDRSLQRWFSSIGSPTSLQEADIPEDDIDTIAENASILVKLWGLKDYTKEVVSEILHLCKA